MLFRTSSVSIFVIGYSVEAPYYTGFRQRLRLRISGSLLCDLLDGEGLRASLKRIP